MSEPVLTSSFCTQWGSYNTPRLWAMVCDEDDPDAWRQVAAWGAISGAVKDQRAQLLKAREALVAAWPPEQNKSSEAFIREVDELIGRMDADRAAADDTATGLANILEALRQAKNNIRPLWEQYQQKSDDLVPAWWDNAEDELDAQARAHMITAEQIVQDNVARLRVPDPYALEPADPHFTPTPLTGDSGAAGSAAGGVSGAGGAVGEAGASAGGGVTVPVPHDPIPPLPGHDPIAPGETGVGGSAGAGAGAGAGIGVGGAVGVGSGPGLAGVINNPPVVTPPTAGGVAPAGGGGPGVVPPAGPIVGPGVGGPGIGGPGVGGTGLGGTGRGIGGQGIGGRGAGGPGPVGTGGSRRGGSGRQPGAGVDGVEPGARGTSGLRAGGAGRGAGSGGSPAGGIGQGAGSGGLPAGGVGRGAGPGGRPAAGRQALPSGAVIGETVAGEGRGRAGGAGGAGVSGPGVGGAGVGSAGRGVASGGGAGDGGGAGRGVAGGGGAGDGGVRRGVAGGGGAGRGGVGGGGAEHGGVSLGSVGGAAGRATGARGGTTRRASDRDDEQARPPRPDWLPDEPAGADPAAGVPGSAGGAHGRREPEAGGQQPYDPDRPWGVAAGVDPVIVPGQDTARHDPGPNVIGWHG